MNTTLAIFLLINAVWNAIVWPQFLRRVAKDPKARDAHGKPTTFLKVHVVLISISLVIAALSLVFGILGLVVR